MQFQCPHPQRQFPIHSPTTTPICYTGIFICPELCFSNISFQNFKISSFHMEVRREPGYCSPAHHPPPPRLPLCSCRSRWKGQAALNLWPDEPMGPFQANGLITTNRLKATELCRRPVAKGAGTLPGDTGHGVPPRAELGQPDGLPAASSTTKPARGPGLVCPGPSPVRSLPGGGCVPLHHPHRVWHQDRWRGCTSPREPAFRTGCCTRMRATVTTPSPRRLPAGEVGWCLRQTGSECVIGGCILQCPCCLQPQVFSSAQRQPDVQLHCPAFLTARVTMCLSPPSKV